MNWTSEELNMFSQMEIKFDVNGFISDSDLEDLYDIVPEYLQMHGFDIDDNFNKVGRICDDIITKLVIIMRSRNLID